MGGDDEIVLEGAAKRFGAQTALHPTDLVITRGQAALLVGANGAGKSSLLKAVQGMVRLSGGNVIFDGEDISRWSAPKRVQNGISLVPEGRQIFVSMSVEDNLL